MDNFEALYLSCQWNKARELLSLLIDSKSISSRKYADFADYLNFCSQGLPRRLFSAIDLHTKRDNSEFYLGLPPSEQKRIKLCAALHRILWGNRKEILGSYIDSVQDPLRDKALRGAYHLTDRIFRVAKFSFQDVNTVATQISETIIHPKRERVLRNLLRTFEDYGLLVREENTYSLSETVMERVKEIPNWLRDGYVNAQEFIDEIQRIDEREEGPALDMRLVLKHQPGATADDAGADRFEQEWAPRPERSDPETTKRRFDSEEAVPLSGFELALRRGGLEGVTLNGRYVVSRMIGQGGMSSVYLASDSKLLNRAVVIKLMFGGSLLEEWKSLKFQHEAEALARVDHPGIVGILDAGETLEGIPYIVMQYVEGATLRSVLGPEGMYLERVGNIIEQLCNALGAAHDSGIIHRDLKPENIMIQSITGDSERIKVIDFGIAKVQSSMFATTATGMFAGTIAYMSPEQLVGEKVTAASDIYALGVVTYEMVTGRRPFNPETPFQMLEMQRAGIRIIPRDLRPALPEAAQKVILKALHFHARERYQKATEFGTQLRKALT